MAAILVALEPVIEALFKALIPALFGAAKDHAEIAKPSPLNDLYR